MRRNTKTTRPGQPVTCNKADEAIEPTSGTATTLGFQVPYSAGICRSMDRMVLSPAHWTPVELNVHGWKDQFTRAVSHDSRTDSMMVPPPNQFFL